MSNGMKALALPKKADTSSVILGIINPTIHHIPFLTTVLPKQYPTQHRKQKCLRMKRTAVLLLKTMRLMT